MPAENRADDAEQESGPDSAAEHGCNDHDKVLAVASSALATQADVAHPVAGSKPGQIRRPIPSIDLDDHIRKAHEAIKIARKQVQQARVQAKLEKRKKQRLVRKASTLNVEDLERIAVLKRCGFISEQPSEDASSKSASSTASAEPSPASSHAAQKTP